MQQNVPFITIVVTASLFACVSELDQWYRRCNQFSSNNDWSLQINRCRDLLQTEFLGGCGITEEQGIRNPQTVAVGGAQEALPELTWQVCRCLSLLRWAVSMANWLPWIQSDLPEPSQICLNPVRLAWTLNPLRFTWILWDLTESGEICLGPVRLTRSQWDLPVSSEICLNFEPSEIHLNLVRHDWIQWDSHESGQICLDPVRLAWTQWDLPERWIRWDSPESCGIWLNLVRFTWIQWDLPESVQIGPNPVGLAWMFDPVRLT